LWLITFFYSLVKKNLNFYSINIKLNFSLFNNLKKQFNLIINKLYLINFFIFKKDKSFLFKESIRFKIKKNKFIIIIISHLIINLLNKIRLIILP
jgi:hypothetical protein